MVFFYPKSTALFFIGFSVTLFLHWKNRFLAVLKGKNKNQEICLRKFEVI